MTETTETDSVLVGGISRRKLLAAGTVAAGAVWVAPAVESFTSVAAAGSVPTQGVSLFSFVTVLVEDSSGTYYRAKFDLGSTPAVPGGDAVAVSATGNCGLSFNSGVPTPKDDDCFAGLPDTDPTAYDSKGNEYTSTNTVSTTCPYLTGSYKATSSTSGTFTVSPTSPAGATTYTLLAWVVHRGSCCVYAYDAGTVHQISSKATSSCNSSYSPPTESDGSYTFVNPSNTCSC